MSLLLSRSHSQYVWPRSILLDNGHAKRECEVTNKETCPSSPVAEMVGVVAADGSWLLVRRRAVR